MVRLPQRAGRQACSTWSACPATRAVPAACRTRCAATQQQPRRPPPTSPSPHHAARVAAALLAPLLAAPGAAIAAADAAVADAASEKYSGFLEPLVNGLEDVLKFFQSGLEAVHVPYAYGWSICLLTLTVKVATLPFTRKQVESTLSMQQLKPQVDAIKARYGDDNESVSRETKALYAKAGVNPTAGCLPTLATLPIYFALYRSLSNVSREGLLNEGFFWIPSLAGPTTLAQQQAGAGTAWLLPLVDGAPPIGWDAAAPYLVLPVLLVLAQWASSAVLSPIDPNSENRQTQTALVALLPLMVGWFSLNVPSGLSLYYFANSLTTTAVQVYLKKLGGANVDEFDLGPLELGKGRRLGPAVQPHELLQLSEAASVTDVQAQYQNLQAEAEKSSADLAGRMGGGGDGGEASAAGGAAVAGAAPAAMQAQASNGNGGAAGGEEGHGLNRRCKRRKEVVGGDAEPQADAAAA